MEHHQVIIISILVLSLNIGNHWPRILLLLGLLTSRFLHLLLVRTKSNLLIHIFFRVLLAHLQMLTCEWFTFFLGGHLFYWRICMKVEIGFVWRQILDTPGVHKIGADIEILKLVLLVLLLIMLNRVFIEMWLILLWLVIVFILVLLLVEIVEDVGQIFFLFLGIHSKLRFHSIVSLLILSAIFRWLLNMILLQVLLRRNPRHIISSYLRQPSNGAPLLSCGHFRLRLLQVIHINFSVEHISRWRMIRQRRPIKLDHIDHMSILLPLNKFLPFLLPKYLLVISFFLVLV